MKKDSEKLSKATDRSKPLLAAQAMALQEWQVEAIKEGIAAAERGDLVGHDKALAVLERWGRKKMRLEQNLSNKSPTLGACHSPLPICPSRRLTMKRSNWLVLFAALYLATAGVCFGSPEKQATAPQATKAEMERNKGEQQRLEHRLGEIGKKLDELEAKAKAKKAEVKADYRKEIAALRKQQKGLKKQLRELKTASGKAWSDLKAGTENAMDELEKAYQKAVTHLQ